VVHKRAQAGATGARDLWPEVLDAAGGRQQALQQYTTCLVNKFTVAALTMPNSSF
jgi:hypothetical protein